MGKLGGVLLALLLIMITVPAQAASYTVSRCGNSSGRVLLTLDDWPDDSDPYRTTRTGAYLANRDVRAAFFLIGNKAEKYPDIVTTLRAQGHWVMNHTYSHPHLTQLSDSAIRTEISKGVKSNRLRPPYKDYDARVSSIASSLGYRICTWTIEPSDHVRDASGQLRSVATIRSRIRNAPASAKASGVILGHLWTNYPDALGGIIDDLHKDGYLLCRINGPTTGTMPFPMNCQP